MERDEDETKEALLRLLHIVEEVRKTYPRMELSQLSILLTILAEPGLWAKDLMGRVDLKKSALSRNVKALSNLSYITDDDGKPRAGLDLITQIPDALDQRAFQLAPTRKGRQFAERIAYLLNKKGR